MAVKMRLRRMGRRNRPFYRIVVADSRYPRDGRFIDMVGHYDPLRDPAEVVIDDEKVMKWLGNGVEMSDTVRSILSREGVLKKWHETRFGGPKKVEKAAGREEAKTEAGKTTQKTTVKKSGTETETRTEKKTAKKSEKSPEK